MAKIQPTDNTTAAAFLNREEREWIEARRAHMRERPSQSPIHVHYSDGSEDTFSTIEEAQDGIHETVTGSDFATTVELVQDDDGNTLYCEWSLILKEQP